MVCFGQARFGLARYGKAWRGTAEDLSAVLQIISKNVKLIMNIEMRYGMVRPGRVSFGTVRFGAMR